MTCSTPARLWLRPEFDTLWDMEKVSIQDLKAGLSAVVAKAQAGATIVITRHNEPVAQLGPARPDRVHREPGRDWGASNRR